MPFGRQTPGEGLRRYVEGRAAAVDRSRRASPLWLRPRDEREGREEDVRAPGENSAWVLRFPALFLEQVVNIPVGYELAAGKNRRRDFAKPMEISRRESEKLGPAPKFRRMI